jgi:hypothetical protein
MNVGGNQYCPVCREQTLLVIYEYVSPIDEAFPDPARGGEVEAVLGGDQELVVLPMQPKSHRLKVSWYVDTLKVTTENAREAAPEPLPAEAADPTAPAPPDSPYPDMGNPFMGRRGQGPRDDYAEPPAGKLSPLGTRARKGKKGYEYAFPIGKLPAGAYVITAEVWDDTDMVIKDERHLLKERISWTVKVAPPEKPDPPSTKR